MSDSMKSFWNSAIWLEYLRKEHVQTFFILPFYLFFIIETSLLPKTGFISPYTIGFVLLLIYILWDALDKYVDGETTLRELNKFLNQFSLFIGFGCAVLFCLDQLIRDQNTFVFSFLQAVIPLSSYMCYQDLIHENQIQTDSWQPISTKISELAKKGRSEDFGRVVCLLPESSSKKHPYGGYKYISPKNVNRMNLASKNQQIGTNYSTQNAPFFILNTDALGKKPTQFIPLSEEALSKLTKVASTHLPPKIDHINMVTHAHLMLAQWFEYSPEDNASFFSKEMHDIQFFLGRRKKTTVMVDHEHLSTETNTKAAIEIAHVWNQKELCFAAKLLVDSIVDQDSSDHLSRISDVFWHRMKNLNEHHGSKFSAASRFISLLSSEFTGPHSENSSFSPLAMMESFSRACKVLDLEYETKNPIEDCRTRSDFEKLLKANLFTASRCHEKPVESFIKNHDMIVQFGQDRDEGRAYRILSQIVNGMMEELQKTSFQRTLVQESRFDAAELIEIRNGIVAGTAVALELMTKIMKAR